jgi:RsiW-degrading membrane proteinase PrsW (M82 family)
VDDASTIALASPLRRPKVARRLTIALSVLLLFAAVIVLAVVGGSGPEAARVFLSALALSTLLAAFPILILWYLDRRERESPWLFAAAFLWGGLIATTLALPANTAIIAAVGFWLDQNAALREMLGPDAALIIGAPLAAPLVEETTKGLGIVLLFWLMRAEFDNVRDGFIYGALVGAGFNWFESALYVQQNFLQFGTASYGFQLGTRYAWLGLAGHAMFSGIFGASLGLARATRNRFIRYTAPLAGYLLAIFAHTWNNVLPLVFALAAAGSGEAPPSESVAPPAIGLTDALLSASLSDVVIFLPFAALLVWIVRRSGKAERRVICEEMSGEAAPCVTPAEYAAMQADRTYHTRRIDGRNRSVSSALVNAQNELAFRKRRLRDRGFDPATDPVAAALRAQISALRQHLGS